MTAAQRNLVADADATYRLALRRVQPGGTPKDAAGTTAALELRLRSYDELRYTYPATADADGWLVFTVPRATVATWSGAYAYRVVVTAGTEADALLVGRLTVRTGRDV